MAGDKVDIGKVSCQLVLIIFIVYCWRKKMGLTK